MAEKRATFIFVLVAMVVTFFQQKISAKLLESPRFTSPIANNTVAVGREAILACSVENLPPYKVAWLRVDTQTILTIHNHVITKNSRIGITHSEQKTWYLHIKEVKESDRGWYMCQINTDPMKSQVGYLDVVVPPDIIDHETSGDVEVNEGSNITLQCVAKGSPIPVITWKRENGNFIPTQIGTDIQSVTGSTLTLTKIKREHMGPYLCIASNGVPPSVSKRIMVIVKFPPTVWIQYQLVGTYEGQKITLECHSEAFPKAINYWARDNGDIIPRDANFIPKIENDGYKVHMILTILKMGPEDFGLYRCISKNSLGEMEGTINIYSIPTAPLNIKNRTLKTKDANKKLNEVTYQIGSSKKGSVDLQLLGDEYYKGSAHQTIIFLQVEVIILWSVSLYFSLLS